MKNDTALAAGLAVCGGVIWGSLAAASGRTEAWDTSLYFSIAMPALCLLAFACGFLRPERPWRWGIAPFVGQLVWMLVAQRAGSLLPLGVIMFGILSLPAIAAAKFGARIGLKRAG